MGLRHLAGSTALTLALVACAPRPFFTGARAPLDVAPATTAVACGECHPTQLRAWRASRHSQAWGDPLFRASFARARMRWWCLNCHLPLSAQRGPEAAALREEGVTCVVCHLREGLVLSAAEPSNKGRQAHPMRREPRLAESSWCGNCHQFAQPVLDRFPLTETALMAQDTLTEAQRFAPERRCQTCHFTTHQAWGAHDVVRLREAVQVHQDGGTLTLSLAGVGHKLPTGDPFRTLRVEACGVAGCEQPLRQWVLGRKLDWVDGGVVERRDTRLEPGRPRDFALPVGTAGWRVVYGYAEPGLEVPGEVEVTVAASPREFDTQ